ncbi:prephenate dehydratase [Granulosicoccus antarcticus]|uniref:Bifunctional chorismate mutase/prephenate dehydratase n=1 Tax=Granulosicoccus antarcticus IMCC3135 TaxID=1192854 RepID=A0A2Z2NUH6_9GAMM|nr:prephenate dehydratase [Granulosicoccus antarcticus]ASJ75222.1 P-protein [Granulosicoccus antarcticus IMCC3135]
MSTDIPDAQNQPQTDTDKPLDLAAVRKEIDALDLQIQSLLNQRAAAALKVAKVKLAEAAGKPVDFYRPEREAQILKEVASRNGGPMSDYAVQRIFREIISASLALEEPMRVAYLGPEGTYSHAAADRHFGFAVQSVPESSIADIFHAVETGRVRFGVVPVENSTEGAINLTLDLLTQSSLRVCGELSMRIQHCLLSRSESLDDIKTVHAHPQALAQCRHWLDANLPNAERISESSNAAAAKLALEHPEYAAIAGETAGKLYGLNSLVVGIEDDRNNTTRFLVIGDQDIPPSGDDATLLMVAAPHRPGGLRHILAPLETAGVSMTRIESRPSRSALWEYHFFIAVTGHQHDSNLSPVLDELRELTPLLKVIGSYPRAL